MVHAVVLYVPVLEYVAPPSDTAGVHVDGTVVASVALGIRSAVRHGRSATPFFK